jgi:uncharacterized protein (TIGR03435 family)
MSSQKQIYAVARIAVGLALPFLFISPLSAQTPQSETASPTSNSSIQFEVATIKPHDPKSAKPMGVRLFPGGRVEIIGLSVKALVCSALHVSWWQVSGGDPWTQKEEYDIEAVPPDNLRASFTDLKYTWYGIDDGRLRQMLTALLTARFQLRFHRETKTGTVYLLQRSGKPLRLAISQRARRTVDGAVVDPSMGTIGVAGNWNISDTSMSQLAKFASDYILHAPVLDETHLQGSFDYRSPTEVDMSTIESSDAAFPGFVSEMGLQLKKSRGPVETIVIDSAGKPTEN